MTDRIILATIAYRAMVERGLEPDFPQAVALELASLARPANDTRVQRDLRDRLWVSIDNEDSRDLDQLTLAEPLDAGRVRIFVAVADVDGLVKKGSAIDAHAAHNTTSIYTPAAIFPMLPEALSTDLTSLNENQDRLAIVTEMLFESNGTLSASAHYQAQVCNQAKLAYPGVGAWLIGTGAVPARVTEVDGLEANLRLQDSVAQRLNKNRQDHGALTLETLEPRAIFSGDAMAQLEPSQKNRATQLIEEFMIAANEATATYLATKNFPSLRRILRSPERWDRIVQLASTLRETLPAQPESLALGAFLAKRRQADPEKFPDLSLAVVKLIGKGEYELDLPGGEPPGHFALALQDYTHSTAPNRRFPDLITQRLVKAALVGAPLPYSIAELEKLAQYCTQREDDATKVERRMRKSAAALLLSRQIGESFDAIVTGASNKGTWVRLFQPPIEGRLENGLSGLNVGDHLRVKLVHTNIERGFIDFVRD